MPYVVLPGTDGVVIRCELGVAPAREHTLVNGRTRLAYFARMRPNHVFTCPSCGAALGVRSLVSKKEEDIPR